MAEFQVRPRASVVTVVDTASHLGESLSSLQAQPMSAWEWVVVVHSGQRWRPVTEDPRIRVIVEDNLTGRGRLKRLGCSVALGDVIVELRDGDLMAPGALEEIVESFEGHSDVGLVYGDTARIADDGSPDDLLPDVSLGWETEHSTIGGGKFVVLKALEPTPHNVSHPWYAPSRGIAFRRNAYEASGGYDAERNTLEVEDLVCRLFQRTAFRHISKCLYMTRTADDQEQSPELPGGSGLQDVLGLYDSVVEANALAWSRRNDLLALDLGSASGRPEGFVSVAGTQDLGVSAPGSIAGGLDLPDASVGVVRAVDVLQHVADKVGLFNEVYRLLAHGGLLLSLTPSTDGRGAFQDPTNVAYYNENSFWYFTDREYAATVPSIRCRFQVSRLVTYYPGAWGEQNQVLYVCANLIAIKDGPRQGGQLSV